MTDPTPEQPDVTEPAGPSAPAVASVPPPAGWTLETAVKETLISIVVAFILAFVFRGYVVEAFVIPTGSMNPTLHGRHVDLTCPQCGYRFSVDVLDQDLLEVVEVDGRAVTVTAAYVTKDRDAACPMCYFEQSIQGLGVSPGDRILVQKIDYALHKPRRWDVVVFKNPQDVNEDGSIGPLSHYIKRCVGLPNESLLLIDGDVYTAPTATPGAADTAWRIARKTDRRANPHAFRIQREAWQPIAHTRYLPLDNGEIGEDGRRQVQCGERWGRFSRAGAWAEPTRAGYVFEADRGAVGDDAMGVLEFRWPSADHTLALIQYPYNQLDWTKLRPSPIEDVRVAASLRPAHAGVSVTMQTTSRLNDREGRLHAVSLRVDASGRVRAVVTPADPEGEGMRLTLFDVEAAPLSLTRATPVELWVVDQSVLAWVGGELVGEYLFETRGLALLPRTPAAPRPTVRVTVEGGGAALIDLALDRDVYYDGRRAEDRRYLGRGAASHGPGGLRPYRSKPVTLGDAEYFCLGDNPPRSSDGRFWQDVNPWVRERYFDREDPEGIVPEALIVGRAVLVYFPAPYPVREGGRGVRPVPNFGDVRVIH